MGCCGKGQRTKNQEIAVDKRTDKRNFTDALIYCNVASSYGF